MVFPDTLTLREIWPDLVMEKRGKVMSRVVVSSTWFFVARGF
jgi:hypothetical protein